MSKKIGHIYCHIACFILGFSALFPKVMSWPIVSINFYRSVLASIVLFLILFSTKKLPHIPKKELPLHLLLGALLTAHWMTYFYAVYLSTVAIGLISLFTFPVITALIEPFFHKQRPKLKDVIIALSLLPGLILINKGAQVESGAYLGIIVGVSSAVFYSFRNILSKKLTASYSGPSLMMIQTALVSLFLSPSLFFVDTIFTVKDTVLVIVLALFFSVLAHSLFVSSFRYISAKSASIIASAQPLYGTFWGIIFLNEIPHYSVLLGGSIILCLVLYETYTA